MKEPFGRFSCASLIALLIGIQSATHGFDISVYFDPTSAVRITADQTSGFPDTCGCQGWDYNCKLNAWLSSVANNDSAIQWWREMGVNRLCTYYTLSDFDMLTQFDSTFKMINYRWPERMYQYLEAQG